MFLSAWGKQAIGIFYVSLVVVLWVSSSEIIQSIFQNDDFDHPFFLTYYSTALFLVYLPFFGRLFLNQCMAYYHGSDVDPLYTALAPSSPDSYRAVYPPLRTHDDDDIGSPPSPPNPSIECVEMLSHNQSFDYDDDDVGTEHDDSDDNNARVDGTSSTSPLQSCYNTLCISSLYDANKFDLWQTLKLSMLFCPIWFSMNYTFNLSLNMTSVASNTCLSTMSGPFSLLLSRCLLHTHLSFYNLGGVAVTLLGAVFVGYLDQNPADDDNDHGSLLGDALALLSAFMYGCYVTLIKYKIQDESSVNMFLFFALLGLINVVCLWPFLFILHYTHYEQFQWPPPNILGLLTLNGLISVASDYFWAQSILYTSPVVATVGLSMMMPVAMIADEVFRGEKHSVLYWSGSMFVMCGFILVNLDFKKQHQTDAILVQDDNANDSEKETH